MIVSDWTGCEEVRCMSTREKEEVRGSMCKVTDQRAGCVEVRCCGLTRGRGVWKFDAVVLRIGGLL